MENQQDKQRNCFVFAIGGTGSRVLRSLTHLLAAGMQPASFGLKPEYNFSIVPIIIDPDHMNSDLDRTNTLLKNYKAIKETAKPTEPEGFFSIEVKTLKDLAQNAEIPPEFTFKLDGADSSFKEYIGFDDMSEANRAFADLLFSGDSRKTNGDSCKLLEIDMEIGFLGNPNVGSVVFSQIVGSKVYGAFVKALKPGDRIFIISSIFGGTGAAGFPCLLKNFREGIADANGTTNTDLKNAKVGAVSVLPYFKLLKKEGSPISDEDFVAKTKSALNYYEKNVTNGSVNAMYYVGDEAGDPYKNNAGGDSQKNDANFIEMIGAFSIMHFICLQDNQMAKPVYREFGIKRDVPRATFYDLGPIHEKLKFPLSRFTLFRKFMVEEYPRKMGKLGWSTADPQLGENFISSEFYRTYMNPFWDDFDKWLKELFGNNRGFAPFNLDIVEDEILWPNTTLSAFIKKPSSHGGKFTYDGSGFINKGFNDYLTDFAKKKYEKIETKLLDIFYRATKEILEKEYKL